MVIAINCWALRKKQLDGIGYFTVNTISRVIKNHPEVKFVILCDKNYSESYFEFPNVEYKKIFPPYRHPILYFFYFEFIMPLFLKKLKPDLLVSADGFLSLNSSCKQLSIIYDLNFEHFPENLALKNRVYYRFFFKKFARKASRIATISEYSKNDIVNMYKILPEKIDNVSCGINSNFNVLDETEKQNSRNRFSDGKPFFFFIGSVHPRKNVNRLILAFNQFKSRNRSEIKLVIGGAMLWNNSEIIDTYEKSPFKDEIKFIGRLSDEDLKEVLGAAYALTFVPVFEGFGLPIVEAFEAQVPVLTSNVTSLPEVAGNAAIYVDPFNINDISNGLEELYNNKNELCQFLISEGVKRKNKFSWDKTSALFWDCVLRALK